MPLYEYRCAVCGHAWEADQRITDLAIRYCPKCGCEAAHRLLSPVAAILKGDGWGRDGYGGKEDGDGRF